MIDSDRLPHYLDYFCGKLLFFMLFYELYNTKLYFVIRSRVLNTIILYSFFLSENCCCFIIKLINVRSAWYNQTNTRGLLMILINVYSRMPSLKSNLISLFFLKKHILERDLSLKSMKGFIGIGYSLQTTFDVDI